VQKGGEEKIRKESTAGHLMLDKLYVLWVETGEESDGGNKQGWGMGQVIGY